MKASLHCLSLILLSAGVVPAATQFSPEQILFVNNPLLSAYAADLDGDMDQDLVINGDAGLSVMFNLDGAGDFGPRLTIGDTKTALDALADLDGDGDLDILSVEVPGPSRPIVWYRNDSGTFSAPISVRTENSSLQMFPPMDVDGDDDLDLIWYDGSSEVIEWMENSDGEGDFSSPQTIQSLENMLLPAMADLNGDDIPDVVAGDWKGTGLSADDELVWLPGQNTIPLSFGSEQTIAGSGLSRLAHGDIDGDGAIDLVVNGPPGTIQWLKNNGSGGFTVPIPLATVGFTPENVSIVDLDDDGFNDVLFSVQFEDAHWCRNTDGMGAFAAPVAVASPSVLTFDSVVAADIDGDDALDLITVEETELALRPQEAVGITFGAAVILVAAVEDITDVAAVDFDSDSDPDILFSSEDGKLQVMPNLGDGMFGGASLLMDGLDDLEVILPVSLDGLGGVDLIALRSEHNLVGWHAGNGAGSFAAAALIDDFGFNPSAATVADFNGDGSPDVAVAFSDDQVCSWYSQHPTSHAFTFHPLSGTIDSTRAIASGDIDGDMDPDIVTGGFGDGKIYAYINNGTGGFGAATTLGTAPPGLDQIELADIDGDLDLDILTRESSGVDSTITALLNDGSGSFPTSRNVYTGGTGESSMAVGDLDQDGDPDIVSANFNSDSVRWHENDGGGVFTPQSLSPAAISGPYNVDLSDLDDDGDLDVLSVSRFTGTVGWFRNDYRPPPPGDDPITVWAWARGVPEPAVLDPQSDGDGDGLTLLEEFAFSLDPLVADVAPVASDGDSGTPDLWFTFGSFYRSRGIFIRRRDREAIGLAYIIETSPDLANWATLAPGSASNVDANYQRVNFNRVISRKPERHFTRIRLQYDPPDGE